MGLMFGFDTNSFMLKNLALNSAASPYALLNFCPRKEIL